MLSHQPKPTQPPPPIMHPSAVKTKIVSHLTMAKLTSFKMSSLPTCSELYNYAQSHLHYTLTHLSTWLQTLGCSPRTATYLSQFIIIVSFLLVPLILSALVFTATLLLFSVSFIMSAILTSLAIVIVVITVCLFIGLVVVAFITAAILGITALMALVLSGVALVTAPVLVGVRVFSSIDFAYFNGKSRPATTPNPDPSSPPSSIISQST